MGTLCGAVRAAGSANAIAMIASATVSTTTMPVARIAAGGWCTGVAWVCRGTVGVTIASSFHSSLN
jgi:hypothetical protein